MGKISKLRLRWNVTQGVTRRELETLAGCQAATEQEDEAYEPVAAPKKTPRKKGSSKIIHLQD